MDAVPIGCVVAAIAVDVEKHGIGEGKGTHGKTAAVADHRSQRLVSFDPDNDVCITGNGERMAHGEPRWRRARWKLPALDFLSRRV